MALEIKQLTAISWKGCSVLVPEELLLTNQEDQTFLKLRPSHHAITKLICPDCKKKNMSLSAGKNMSTLVALVHAETLDKKVDDPPQAEAADDLFNKEEQKPQKRQKKEKDHTPAPKHAVQIALPNGGALTVMWPASKHADVAILLEATNVQNCFEFLEADCADCEGGSKRAYQKTGKFVKPPAE